MPAQDLRYRHLQANTFLELTQLLALEHQRVRAALAEQDLDGVTPGQSRALMVLFQARRPLTAREAAAKLGVSEVTMGRFVKGLVALGFVQRTQDPDDRRAYRLAVTAKARTRLPQFIQVSNRILDEIFRGFEPGEVAAIASTVCRMRTNLG